MVIKKKLSLQSFKVSRCLSIKAPGFTIYIKNFLLYLYVLGDILDVAVQKSDFYEIIFFGQVHTSVLQCY